MALFPRKISVHLRVLAVSLLNPYGRAPIFSPEGTLIGSIGSMAAYAISIFAGAFLLFQVQPLMGKYLLPWFGGAPGVWTTCMLFFQVLLLAGYAYAHLSSRFLKPKGQVVLHLALVLGALATLPITPSDAWKPHPGADPTLRIIALLTVSLGLPYFVLAATAPLLQHWFTRTHPATSPYRLYALSNTASLLALLTYPTVFEVYFTRKTQAAFWGAGLLIYGLAAAFAGFRLWRAPSLPGDVRETGPVGEVRKPAKGDQLLWLLFPACACVLLLGITNKICQDVAVVPFLWVLPLALYLLTFIICFDKPRWYNRWWSVPAAVAAIGMMTWELASPSSDPVPIQIALYCAGLFLCCMVCHGETYRLKPAPAYLTSFYLMIAAGGATGGVFVAVLAPQLFRDYFELHAGLLLCGALLLVTLVSQPNQRMKLPIVTLGWAAGFVALVFAGVSLWQAAHRSDHALAYKVRNFYGVLKVFRFGFAEPERSALQLSHGHILHGMQFADPKRLDEPTLYYTPGSGINRTFGLLPGHDRRVGLVGLGTGTLAAYARAGDLFRFYEINPEVERVARSHFSFLARSQGKMEVILGDARLSMESEPPQNYDLLVLDAFSSDAIPVHLLTREAFSVYRRHLKTNGLIVVHVTNLTLNLEPIVTSLAHELGYKEFIMDWAGSGEAWWVLPSTWILLSRDPELSHDAKIAEAARPPILPGSHPPLWTDDFAGLFPIVRWQELLLDSSNKAREYAKAGTALEEAGDLAGAIAQFRKAVEHDPKFADAFNNLAWHLATAPDPKLRNGNEAVQLAETACTLTQYRQTMLVGTLAAAYAEAGRFDDAVGTAERACKMAEEAGQQELLDRNQKLLTFYRSGRAFHREDSRGN